jgi:hypothetical protein
MRHRPPSTLAAFEDEADAIANEVWRIVNDSNVNEAHAAANDELVHVLQGRMVALRRRFDDAFPAGASSAEPADRIRAVRRYVQNKAAYVARPYRAEDNGAAFFNDTSHFATLAELEAFRAQHRHAT